MLVLTRRIGETLTVGNEVTVTVVSVKSNQIRFAIKAPREVDVHREEIYQRIAASKQLDAQPAALDVEPKNTEIDQ